MYNKLEWYLDGGLIISGTIDEDCTSEHGMFTKE